MAKISVKLDRRYKNAKGESPIVFFISKNRTRVSISSGVYAKENIVTGEYSRMIDESVPTAKKINTEIYTQFLTYNTALQELTRTGKEYYMTPVDIKNVLLNRKSEGAMAGSFTSYAQKHIEKWKHSEEL